MATTSERIEPHDRLVRQLDSVNDEQRGRIAAGCCGSGRARGAGTPLPRASKVGGGGAPAVGHAARLSLAQEEWPAGIGRPTVRGRPRVLPPRARSSSCAGHRGGMSANRRAAATGCGGRRHRRACHRRHSPQPRGASWPPAARWRLVAVRGAHQAVDCAARALWGPNKPAAESGPVALTRTTTWRLASLPAGLTRTGARAGRRGVRRGGREGSRRGRRRGPR